MIYTPDLTNNYICLVLRKFYSRFMFYLVLRNYRPKFYNMDMNFGTNFLVI